MAKRIYATEEERKAGAAAAQARYRATGKKPFPTLDAGRKSLLKTRYGISPERYQEMAVFQNGVCAICGGSAKVAGKKFLSVDHCHSTNKVRGLLCHYCNSTLGFAKDNVEILAKAIGYLNNGGVNYA